MRKSGKYQEPPQAYTEERKNAYATTCWQAIFKSYYLYTKH